MSDTNKFDILPREIKEYLFNFLPLRDFLILSEVSQQFRNETLIFKRIIFVDELTPKGVLLYPDFEYDVEMMGDENSEAVRKIVTERPESITEFTFMFAYSNLNPSELLAKMTNLKKLKLIQGEPIDAKVLANLISLEVFHCDTKYFDFSHIEGLTNLKELKFEEIISTESLIRLPKLKNLSLSVRELTKKGQDKFLNLMNLDTLSVKFWESLSIDKLPEYSVATKLSFFESNITGEEFYNFKRLTSLTINYCSEFKGRHLRVLNLKSLSICSAEIKDEDIEHMTLLEKLCISATNISKSPSGDLKILKVSGDLFPSSSLRNLKSLVTLDLERFHNFEGKDLKLLTNLEKLILPYSPEDYSKYTKHLKRLKFEN